MTTKRKSTFFMHSPKEKKPIPSLRKRTREVETPKRDVKIKTSRIRTRKVEKPKSGVKTKIARKQTSKVDKLTETKTKNIHFNSTKRWNCKTRAAFVKRALDCWLPATVVDEIVLAYVDSNSSIRRTFEDLFASGVLPLPLMDGRKAKDELLAAKPDGGPLSRQI